MKKKNKLITIIIILGVLLLLSLGFNLNHSLTENKNIPVINKIINEGNVTYKVTLENYYDVEYKNDGNGLELKIKNPCIDVIKTQGLSMKPYWDKHTLGIFDTCFPKEELKEGDIILFWRDDYKSRTHHRIIEIDYEKEWVRTKGDNPETNSKLDDFTSFDKIYAKEIGVLNILEEKKVVKKEIVNITSDSLLIIRRNISFFVDYNKYCVCSSSGFLRFCHENKTLLYGDSFIQQNDLKEEYCQND